MPGVGVVAALLGLGAFAAPAYAQGAAYPTRPIRILVGFPAGGGADVAARVLGLRMSEGLGQQIIVDNRPGAGSAIASEIAAKATPDGHTLVSIGSSHAVNAALYPKLPYKPAADFSAIVLVATAPVAITANPAVPAKTLKELMFASLPGSIDQIRTGRIRAIAVTSAKRSNAAPDIPTVSESGVPGYEASSWFALLAPAGTPKSIVTQLNAEALRTLQTREVRDALVRRGMDPTGSTPGEADAHLRAEIAKWTRVVKEAGIRAE